MHIAFYSPSWPPGGAANGVVTYVDAMSDELRGQGHDVSIVTLDGVYPGSGPDCRRYSLNIRDRLAQRLGYLRGGTGFLSKRLKSIFAELHRRNPIDLIEMEETFGWFGSVAKLDIPLVVRLHGPCFRCPEWKDPAQRDRGVRRRERGERRALEAARAITSPARSTLEDTKSFYELSAPFQDVIVNPVRVTNQNLTWSAGDCDANQLLWVGQFTVRKGADILLRAFDAIADELPELRLDMVGPDNGDMFEGEFLRFEAFCARFVRPAVRERIRMLGLLKPQEIAPLRRRAGLTLVTSRSEVFPYIVAEAMASGSPVLSTRWGGEEEMISDGITGWITDANSPEAVALAIRQIFLAPLDGRAKCGRAGWAFSESNLSQRAVVETTLPLYRAVIKAHGARNR